MYIAGRWINRTDRVVTFSTALYSTWYCYPSFKLPLLRDRHYTQRFMETLPDICPGYSKTSLESDSIFTFQAMNGSKNNTSVVFGREEITTQQVSSFWMDQGKYD